MASKSGLAKISAGPEESAGASFGVSDHDGVFLTRSVSGKFLVPNRQVNGPKPNSPSGTQVNLLGPANTAALNASLSQGQYVVRPTFWKIPGGKPMTVRGFQIYLNAFGVAGTGSTGFDIRIYEANPDGSPIRGAAPLYVWSFNGTGTGTGGAGTGSGTPGTLNLTSGSTAVWLTVSSLPGGSRELPPQFWLATKHDFQGTAPNLLIPSQTGLLNDAMTRLTPSGGSASPSGSSCYTWTEANFTPGEFAIFNASAELVLTGLNAHTVLLDLAS